MSFKGKLVSVHWELMYARSLYPALDMGRQGRILGEIPDLVDAGRIRSTLTDRLDPIEVANLTRGHARVETGSMIGKLALARWR